MQGQKRRKVLLFYRENEEMFKGKMDGAMQEDLYQMQIRFKKSLNMDDINYFKYYSQ